jgi:hypothetical protein
MIRQVFRQRAELIEVLNEILGFDVRERIADFRIVNRKEAAMIVNEIVVNSGRSLHFMLSDGEEIVNLSLSQ